MPLNYGTSEKKEYKPISAGTHVAVWTGFIDLGPQEPKPGPFPKPPQHQVCVIHEIPAERVEVGGELKPARKYSVLNASMEARANLRKWVEATVGKLTDEEAGHFDLFSLVGKGCLITVQQKRSVQGKTYDNITGASPLIAGMPVPAMESEPIIYGGDQLDSFDKLPPWLQEKIKNQLPQDVYRAKRAAFYEARRLADEAKKQNGPPADDPDDPGPFDSDVPF